MTISPTHHLRVRIAGLPKTRNVSVSWRNMHRVNVQSSPEQLTKLPHDHRNFMAQGIRGPAPRS